jgi:Fe-S oxidoreductase
MAQNRKDGFCCGGGGGRMWLEEKIGKRINEMRMDQVLDTQADVLATACPYCLQMFEDAARVKEVEETLKVKDIAELVDEAMEKSPEAK